MKSPTCLRLSTPPPPHTSHHHTRNNNPSPNVWTHSLRQSCPHCIFLLGRNTGDQGQRSEKRHWKRERDDTSQEDTHRRGCRGTKTEGIAEIKHHAGAMEDYEVAGCNQRSNITRRERRKEGREKSLSPWANENNGCKALDLVFFHWTILFWTTQWTTQILFELCGLSFFFSSSLFFWNKPPGSRPPSCFGVLELSCLGSLSWSCLVFLSAEPDRPPPPPLLCPSAPLLLPLRSTTASSSLGEKEWRQIWANWVSHW